MIVLSHSSAARYWNCHWAYYLGYVLRMPEAPEIRKAIGSAVHAGIEAIYKSPIQSSTILARRYKSETEGLPEDKEALFDAQLMLATYKREATKHPSKVEWPFSVEVAGVTWTGIIDQAFEDEDKLLDVKTTAGKTINGRKPSFSPERYDMQLAGYAEGYRALTGRVAKRLVLAVLTRAGKYREYERKPSREEFFDFVRLTSDGIMGRSFEPTGLLNGACSFCPFTEVCEFYDRGD
jgi:hypothetical protein